MRNPRQATLYCTHPPCFPRFDQLYHATQDPPNTFVLHSQFWWAKTRAWAASSRGSTSSAPTVTQWKQRWRSSVRWLASGTSSDSTMRADEQFPGPCPANPRPLLPVSTVSRAVLAFPDRWLATCRCGGPLCTRLHERCSPPLCLWVSCAWRVRLGGVHSVPCV